jgi:hypothetical protein
MPRLRELQEQVFAGLRERPDTAPDIAAALAEASDRLANGIDTLVAGLRRPLTTPTRPARGTVAP